MVASGATMPQRPPASIDMLHSVMRPSIDSAAMALPAYSMAWPCAPSAPIRGDDGERDVLGADAGGRFAVDGDAHALRLLLPQRLRHQHMRDLRRADAERIGAEGAVGRGVAVAADDQQARQRQALFGADDVHDALARIAQGRTELMWLADVLASRSRTIAAIVGIGDGAVAAAGRHVMIGDAEGEAGLGHRASARLHLGEGVERAFMHVVAIDPKQRGAVLAPRDLVRRPQLVDQGLGFAHAGD